MSEEANTRLGEDKESGLLLSVESIQGNEEERKATQRVDDAADADADKQEAGDDTSDADGTDEADGDLTDGVGDSDGSDSLGDSDGTDASDSDGSDSKDSDGTDS